MIRNVNHIGIVCNNFESASKFLMDVLGCGSHDHAGWFRLPNCTTLIHVIDIDEVVPPSEEELYHYYHHTAFETDDLHEILGRALSGGYHVFQMNMTGDESQVTERDDALSFGLRTLFVRDKDGNLWEFLARGHSLDDLFT